MRKFFTLLTASVLVMCALTSCNLDKDMQCTFAYDVIIKIQDEDASKAAEEYMKANFVDKPNLPTYFGRHYDAMQKFIEYFSESVASADHETIRSFLQEPGDYITVSGILDCELGRDWVGTYPWNYAGE